MTIIFFSSLVWLDKKKDLANLLPMPKILFDTDDDEPDFNVSKALKPKRKVAKHLIPNSLPHPIEIRNDTIPIPNTQQTDTFQYQMDKNREKTPDTTTQNPDTIGQEKNADKSEFMSDKQKLSLFPNTFHSPFLSTTPLFTGPSFSSPFLSTTSTAPNTAIPCSIPLTFGKDIQVMCKPDKSEDIQFMSCKPDKPETVLHTKENERSLQTTSEQELPIEETKKKDNTPNEQETLHPIDTKQTEDSIHQRTEDPKDKKMQNKIVFQIQKKYSNRLELQHLASYFHSTNISCYAATVPLSSSEALAFEHHLQQLMQMVPPQFDLQPQKPKKIKMYLTAFTLSVCHVIASGLLYGCFMYAFAN